MANKLIQGLESTSEQNKSSKGANTSYQTNGSLATISETSKETALISTTMARLSPYSTLQIPIIRTIRIRNPNIRPKSYHQSSITRPNRLPQLLAPPSPTLQPSEVGKPRRRILRTTPELFLPAWWSWRGPGRRRCAAARWRWPPPASAGSAPSPLALPSRRTPGCFWRLGGGEEEQRTRGRSVCFSFLARKRETAAAGRKRRFN